MVSLDKAVIARYKHGKKLFEVLVDPEKVDSVRSGSEVDMEGVLAVESVFEDASKGEKATESDLRKVFSTTDVSEIAMKIIKEGEVQLTTEQRRRRVEEKRRLVIDRIARISINPQTNTPHPPSRIEIAMKEAKVHVDPFKSVDELVNEALKQIRAIIPIKIEENEIAVKIPPAYTGRVYELKKKYRVVKEGWQDDGSFIALLRVPAGMKDEALSFLGAITRGEVETRIVK
ncbi:MAG: ribosome assembly factor SBDS [Methanophagales archaeon]|nr:ribosome assembly factor SBDS [Methanophagales archaeon]MCW3138690.1 ribosome assembly factor SBDS [Methanophagales archaeon]MCW3139718.1 ribosome assembly factor SBDS [Methanophagales archaeon]MCW7069165.1 ribosome assembly factor SBDS [Methanophagales archaeon]MCW7072306.1 ribosome assembly factor SBDS [Methanophagales archaeon]